MMRLGSGLYVLGSVPDAEAGHLDEGPVVGAENGLDVEPEQTIRAEYQPVAAAITALQCLCQWRINYPERLNRPVREFLCCRHGHHSAGAGGAGCRPCPNRLRSSASDGARAGENVVDAAYFMVGA